MIDKMLGSDEEIRSSTKKHRGGELVELDGDIDPRTNSAVNEEAKNTAQARADGNIAQTANDEDEDSSDYEEEYENDFHEILEEVVRH